MEIRCVHADFQHESRRPRAGGDDAADGDALRDELHSRQTRSVARSRNEAEPEQTPHAATFARRARDAPVTWNPSGSREK